ASDDDSPLELLRTLASASSMDSWWIFIADFSFDRPSSDVGLPDRLHCIDRNAPPGRGTSLAASAATAIDLRQRGILF
ncbi:MAG TPA: hypothetical protein VII24_11855, partial [Pseudolabrys sp.]